VETCTPVTRAISFNVTRFFSMFCPGMPQPSSTGHDLQVPADSPQSFANVS
jgi:hypothetical protein